MVNNYDNNITSMLMRDEGCVTWLERAQEARGAAGNAVAFLEHITDDASDSAGRVLLMPF